jgi:hypothetical protein
MHVIIQRVYYLLYEINFQCREEWLTFKEKCSTYYNVLDILHTFYRDTSMKENDRDSFVKSSFWDLHILIQTTNDFISVTNELYR